MHFPYAIITLALRLLTGRAVQAPSHDAQPQQLPHCPVTAAPQGDTYESIPSNAYGQHIIAGSDETIVINNNNNNEDDCCCCVDDDPSLQATCITPQEESVTTEPNAAGRGRTEQQGHRRPANERSFRGRLLAFSIAYYWLHRSRHGRRQHGEESMGEKARRQ
ncbi:hypothetical protein J7T55_005290 [Diaporthe amygdali]|uniref:uncharacterized protein n=1 Tax=Phomopsis amygdali TaxID=1214568 RepID=UPI0022FE2DD6|nr:uncharacterized protein J7T55_005290 [Diaporthe amygdali]KAJ0108313.1 hypothetical protein J7T55_005290 [Diaporthe amygdali]